MADWRVSKERIELREHPNADALEIAKVGEYQLVTRKGIYNDGDVVIIIPRKSLLPLDGPIREEFQDYLTGPNKNRVKSVRLRGETSEAITWPVDKLDHLGPVERSIISQLSGIGDDISEQLGIEMYQPPVPKELAGITKPMGNLEGKKHDVYQYASYISEFPDQVIITEKLHGSQLNYFLSADGEEKVSSKGILKRGLAIEKSATNNYWQAVHNANVKKLAEDVLRSTGAKNVQLIGELLAIQKGFDYGSVEPDVRFFMVVADGVVQDYSVLPSTMVNMWVPILFVGDLAHCDPHKLAKGMEQVSGKERHIREGIVIIPRDNDGEGNRAHDGKSLIVKVLNPKYKDVDEEEEVD